MWHKNMAQRATCEPQVCIAVAYGHNIVHGVALWHDQLNHETTYSKCIDL